MPPPHMPPNGVEMLMFCWPLRPSHGEETPPKGVEMPKPGIDAPPHGVEMPTF